MILYTDVSQVGWWKENISICICMLINFVGVKEKYSFVVSFSSTLLISHVKVKMNVRIEICCKKALYIRAHFMQTGIWMECFRIMGDGQQNAAPTWFHTCSYMPQCERTV